MGSDEGNKGDVAVYAALLGSIYIIVGMTEFIMGLWELFWPGTVGGFLGLPADLFGGFSAVVIGAAYIGSVLLWKERGSLGFLLTATLLSIIFGILYLLIVCADGFGMLLWTWEWLTAGTAGPGILRPEIWLALLSLPLGYFALKQPKREGL